MRIWRTRAGLVGLFLTGLIIEVAILLGLVVRHELLMNQAATLLAGVLESTLSHLQ